VGEQLLAAAAALGAGPAEAALTTPLAEGVAMARSLVWEKKP
jgi:hypothetical protein